MSAVALSRARCNARGGNRELHAYAKTGTTGAVREPVVWWVGWVERDGVPTAYFAMNATPTRQSKFAHRYAITRAILKEAGVTR